MRRNKNGFTLLEILIVIAVIAFLSFLVFPRFGDSVNESGFRSGVNSIAGLIRTIHERSVLNRRVYALNIDITKNEYLITILENEEFTAAPDFSEEKRAFDKSISVKDIILRGDSEKVEEEEAVIRFFPNGAIDRSIIHISSSYNPESIYTIFVEPMSGKTRIEKDYVQ